tara:strand:+ start:79 stop:1128 length:1050 start_codon:yes stop_codon:yes gene_type:complete
VKKRKYEFINVKDILLDAKNPRHSSLSDKWVPVSGEATQGQIMGWLSNDGANDLRNSIKEWGGCSNPIHVREADEKLICFDGNTRLSIYKDLLASATQNNLTEEIENWSTIPTFLYPNVTDKEVEEIRLHFHLNGTKDWSKFEQSKELHRLSTLLHDDGTRVYSDAELVTHSGLDNSTLNRRIAAYQMMVHFYQPLLPDGVDLAEREKKFSFFEEYKKNMIQRLASDHNITEELFSTWVAEERLSDSRHVAKLPKILSSSEPKAKQKFFSATPKRASKKAVEALNLTEEQLDELNRIELPDIISRLVDKLKDGIIYDELVEYKSNDGINEIETLEDELRKLKDKFNNIT